MTDLLSILLQVANSSPPAFESQQFYTMKQRILERFGERDGYDIQFITKKCWGYYNEPCGPRCEKCHGTGLFDFFWVRLERWRLGSRVFHRPIERLRRSPGYVTIEGKIEHKNYGGFWANECQLWLALMFDRPLFVKMFWYRWGKPCTWLLPPLVFLSKLRYEWRHRRKFLRFNQDDIPF